MDVYVIVISVMLLSFPLICSCWSWVVMMQIMFLWK